MMGLIEQIKRRFAAPAFALFFEVGNATGARCDRHMDAMAVSLWPSRGLYIHGMEVKATRSDWLRELKDPAKAEAFVKHCDFWSIVALPEVVQPEELPKGWGLLVAGQKRLIESVAPTQCAKPIQDKNFLAAILRRAYENITKRTENDQEISRMRRAEYKRAEQAAGNLYQAALADAKGKAEKWERAIKEFEEASGIRIDEWRAGRLGEVVHMLMHHKNNNIGDLLSETIADLKNTAQRLEHFATAMGKIA